MEVPMNLTPELRQAVQQAGEEPVRIEDPETHDAYYLLKAEVFERVRGVIGQVDEEVPEGVRRSEQAFLRDLPTLMGEHSRRWAAYHGDERVAIGESQRQLIRECLRRGLTEEEIYVGMIVPHAQEPEKIDPSFFEFGEFIPLP
jgi:hypothetical protein